MRTTDASALRDVYDVLTERLDATGARPEITSRGHRFAVPGMFVALRGRPPTVGHSDETA